MAMTEWVLMRELPGGLRAVPAVISAGPEFKKYLDATDGMIVARKDRIVRRVTFKSLA